VTSSWFILQLGQYTFVIHSFIHNTKECTFDA